MKNILIKSLIYWIPLSIVTLGLGIGIYAASQQVLRQDAYDPQIQIVEDTALSLQNGSSPSSLMAGNKINVSTSLSPFIIIYDANKNILGSTGKVSEGGNSENIPQVPVGVLDYAKTHGIDRVTWQLPDGTRDALVMKYSEGNKSYFIASARSLKLVEERTTNLLLDTLLGTAGLLIVSLLATIVLFWWREKKPI